MIDLEFLEADERAINEDIPDGRHHEQSNQIAIVLVGTGALLPVKQKTAGKACQ